MNGAGYQVSPTALRQTAQGIRDTIGALQTLGVEGTADAGRGFSGLSLRGMQVGHAGLQQAFSQFCDRWSWGVRTLVQDGNQIARQLHLTAGAYADAEQYASGVFKDLTADVIGDPHRTDQQVESQSWAQVAADNPINDLRHPDFSAASWQHAAGHIATTWQAETQDMAGVPMDQALAAAGTSPQPPPTTGPTAGAIPGAPGTVEGGHGPG